MILNARNSKYVIGSILLLCLLYFECFIKVNKDFDIFIAASRLIREGKTCYNIWIPSGAGYLLYYYSPLFALILTPLSFLPQHLYYIVWFAINLWFLYRIIRLIDHYLNISEFTNRYRNIFFLLLAVCILRFLLYNFDLGQMTIFLVYASLESIRLILNNKKLYGAALLALAINIKLLPLPLLIYLIYRGEYKASIFVVIIFIIYLFLPGIFIGMNFNMALTSDWWNLMINNFDQNIIRDIQRPGLMPWLSSLFMETNSAIPLRRNILSLTPGIAIIVINIIRGSFILLTLYFLRSLPFKKITSAIQHYYPLAYIMLLTPLIAPHQGGYSFFYLLPAFSYVIYMSLVILRDNKGAGNNRILLKYKFAIAGIIISFLLTTMTSDGIIGRHYSNIANHFYLQTIGALILIIPMILYKPTLAQSTQSFNLSK